MNKLLPRRPVPSLSCQSLTGTRWVLAERRPERFSLIVFYRGLHCAICRTYIGELDKLHHEFARRGVDVVAVSGDTEERARRAREEWGLGSVTIGYGLDLPTAYSWGLYLSSGRGKTSGGIEEPERFNEPGLFLVRPDGTLYCAWIQTMPFARPHLQEIVKAIDFALARDYPARGEVAEA
jgi:peroxiredoxin